MPMINGRFYSAWGNYSFRISFLIHRMQQAAANEQAQANSQTLTDALSSGATQLSEGLGRIAVQRATARIKAAQQARLVDLTT